MTWNTCYKCKCQMWIPEALNEAALASRGACGIRFWCAYGHEQHYLEGETEETTLRRERDRLKQDAARLADEIAGERQRADAAEKKLLRTKKRANAIPQAVSVKQYAAAKQISVRTVWRMIRDKKLEVERLSKRCVRIRLPALIQLECKSA